jgi:hypothetical protein
MVYQFLRLSGVVFAGLGPAIHEFLLPTKKAWMAATSAAMTKKRCSRNDLRDLV